MDDETIEYDRNGNPQYTLDPSDVEAQDLLDATEHAPPGAALGAEFLARDRATGRWYLSDKPIHAGDGLYVHNGMEWVDTRFEWVHRDGKPWPTLWLSNMPATFTDEEFGELRLRWRN